MSIAKTQNQELIRAVNTGLLKQGFCLDSLQLAQLDNPAHFALSMTIESEMFFVNVLPEVRKRAALRLAPEKRHRFFRHTQLVSQLKEKVIMTSDIEITSATCEEQTFRLKLPEKFEIETIRSTLSELLPLFDCKQWLSPKEAGWPLNFEVEDLWANVLNMLIDDINRSVRDQLDLALKPNC